MEEVGSVNVLCFLGSLSHLSLSFFIVSLFLSLSVYFILISSLYYLIQFFRLPPFFFSLFSFPVTLSVYLSLSVFTHLMLAL